jgi:hypothetical protein
MTMFAIGSFFSTIAPIISVIVSIFFGLKYWVDKYNFIYCYPTLPYKSDYQFHKNVPIIAAVNLFISKLFIYGIIRSEFGKALRSDLEKDQEGSSEITNYSDFNMAANLYLAIECLMVLLYIIYWWKEADKKI